MKNDVLKRLRDATTREGRNELGIGHYWNLCEEAIAEIQALRVERHQLQNDLTAAGLENERLRRGVPLEYSEHCECCRRNKITLQVFGRDAHEPSVRPYEQVMKQAEREGVDTQDLIATLMKKVEDQRRELARLNVEHRTAVGTRVPVTDRRGESAISEEGVPLCSALRSPNPAPAQLPEVHIYWQGETEWKFHQGCQCWGCRHEYNRLLALQTASDALKSGAGPEWVQCPKGHNYPSWGYCRECYPNGEPMRGP